MSEEDDDWNRLSRLIYHVAEIHAMYPNFVFQRLPVERLFLNFGVIALNFVVYTLLL